MRAAPVVLGIDPGLSGALAVLDAQGRVLETEDMPTLTTGNGRRVLDVVRLRELLTRLPPLRGVLWVEQVGTMPTDSRVSAFAFGRSVGALEACCILSGVPLHRVSPQVWKRAAGLPVGAPKAASLEAAMRLVPSSAQHLTRARDHNRADAVLIALHGLHQSAS